MFGFGYSRVTIIIPPSVLTLLRGPFAPFLVSKSHSIVRECNRLTLPSAVILDTISVWAVRLALWLDRHRAISEASRNFGVALKECNEGHK